MTDTLSMESTRNLAHGGPIPRFGLGVFRAGDETRDAVRWALEIGYRHIDTAAAYRNEADVGEAIRESGLSRDAVFVTTKLWRDDSADARRACEASLRALGFDYVDLYLLHWPQPGLRLQAWATLEALHREGKCRAIGVSNFTHVHLAELKAHADVLPAVNQLELHPFCQSGQTLQWCEDHDVAIEAWGPLTKGQRLDDPTVAAIADEVGRTPAQVLIRWSLQRGFIVIPKSTNRDRIRENAAVFDFALTDVHMARLDALDEGYRTAPGWDPTKVG